MSTILVHLLVFMYNSKVPKIALIQGISDWVICFVQKLTKTIILLCFDYKRPGMRSGATNTILNLKSTENSIISWGESAQPKKKDSANEKKIPLGSISNSYLASWMKCARAHHLQPMSLEMGRRGWPELLSRGMCSVHASWSFLLLFYL